MLEERFRETKIMGLYGVNGWYSESIINCNFRPSATIFCCGAEVFLIPLRASRLCNLGGVQVMVITIVIDDLLDIISIVGQDKTLLANPNTSAFKEQKSERNRYYANSNKT